MDRGGTEGWPIVDPRMDRGGPEGWPIVDPRMDRGGPEGWPILELCLFTCTCSFLFIKNYCFRR